ncbi:MAG: alpha-galactosidase [Novosphingobium sp.]
MATHHCLHGRSSSLVLELAEGGAPLWRYWGPRLGDAVVTGQPLSGQAWHLGFHLDPPERLSVFPGGGLGWFGRSALEAHRDGRDFTLALETCSVERKDNALAIVLVDPLAQIELVLTLSLDPVNDVLTCSTRITNRGSTPLDVQWLASAVLPLPPAASAVRYYGGRHAGEFEPCEDALGIATWSRTNRHGLTSHSAFPGAVVVEAGTTEHGGTAYAAQLAWSGNHVLEIERCDDGGRQWQLGLALAPGELRLAAGETLDAPQVVATCSVEGWQGAARNFHAAARAKMVWPGRERLPRPVHFNTWEGCYFDHDEATLRALADGAAALGIERFVLDDGWFHRRNDDTSSLGDWWPDAAKYPNGLRPLADHVIGLGMEFGLWFEPEMVNPDSDLYRAHPDWALQVDGRPQQLSRNQLVLDLTRSEVRDYLFEAIAKVLREVPVSYIKWDHNRDLVATGDASGLPAFRRQVLAYYDLIGRLRAAFPAVEIECCAGGGGRIDMGVLPYVQRFWPSDNIDALSRIEIQRGFLQFLPPEVMGSHIGASPAHTTGRRHTLDFRAAVAMQGHLGIELDLTKLDADETARVTEWIACYKEWRHLLHGEVWTGTFEDGLCWHAAGSADEWLLIVYRTQPSRLRFAPPARLPFAASDRTYSVRRIGPGRVDEEQTWSGSWLARHGLSVPPMLAERAAIYHGTSQ